MYDSSVNKVATEVAQYPVLESLLGAIQNENSIHLHVLNDIGSQIHRIHSFPPSKGESNAVPMPETITFTEKLQAELSRMQQRSEQLRQINAHLSSIVS